MHPSDLAWLLAVAAGDRLEESKRFDVYVALGAGDTSTAIRELVQVAAREQVELDAEVISAVNAWWPAHKDYDPAQVAKLKIRVEPPAPLCDQLSLPPPVAPEPRKIEALSITRKYLRPNLKTLTTGPAHQSSSVKTHRHVPLASSDAPNAPRNESSV